jgi:hypothetical protein
VNKLHYASSQCLIQKNPPVIWIVSFSTLQQRHLDSVNLIYRLQQSVEF